MNYEQFSDFAGDIAHSHDVDGGSLFLAPQLAEIFGNIPNDLRTLLRPSEKQLADDGTSNGCILVAASGLFKLAFAGTSPEAAEFKVWVAGEVVPLLLINGGYSGLAIHADDQARVAREKGSLMALRVAAAAYAALSGNAPEDRDFQDYLAEAVMPDVLENGVFAASPDDQLRTAAFEALAALH